MSGRAKPVSSASIPANGEPKLKSIYTRVSCETTGVFHGQFVRGISDVTDGTVMQMFFTADGSDPPTLMFRPPTRQALALYEINPVVLRDWFSSIGDTSRHQNIEQLMQFAKTVAVKEALYFTDAGSLCPPMYVRLYSIGTKLMQMMQSDDVSFVSSWLARNLTTGDPPIIPISALYHAIPRKEGSVAARHTLVFRPDIWCVCRYEEKQTPTHAFDLRTLRLVSVSSLSSSIKQNAPTAIIQAERNVGENIQAVVCLLDDAPVSDPASFWTNAWSELQTMFATQHIHITFAEVQQILSLLSTMTPGMLKSLLQKCIRYGAQYTSLFTQNIREKDAPLVDTRVLTACVFLYLSLHPGTFVPEMSRFVCGAESAFKRLGVCMVEDSYHSSDWIMALFFAALSARNNGRALFSQSFLLAAAKAAMETQRDTRFYALLSAKPIADTAQCIEQTYTVQNPTLLYGAFLTLRSFAGDELLVKHLSMKALGIFQHTRIGNNSSDISSNNIRPECMPLYHFVDQHCLPHVVHMFPSLSALTSAMYPLSLTMENIMTFIWQSGTSLNPRHTPDRSVHPLIQRAQRSFLTLLTASRMDNVSFMAQDAALLADYTSAEAIRNCRVPRGLHESALAGKLGTITQGHLAVFMNPQDLSATAVVECVSKRASSSSESKKRNAEQAGLTSEISQTQKKQMHNLFVDRVKRNPVCMSDWRIQCNITRIDDEGVFVRMINDSHSDNGGKEVSWESVCAEEVEYCQADIVQPSKYYNASDDSTVMAHIVSAWARVSIHSRNKHNHHSSSTNNTNNNSNNNEPRKAHYCEVATGYIEQLERFLRDHLSSIPRVAMYLSTMDTKLVPFKINRSGKGVYQQVSIHDIAYFQFLMRAAVYMPGVLRLHKNDSSNTPSFEVIHHPLWETVRSLVRRLAVEQQQQYNTKKIAAVQDDKNFLKSLKQPPRNWKQLIRAQAQRLNRSIQLPFSAEQIDAGGKVAKNNNSTSSNGNSSGNSNSNVARKLQPHQLDCIQHISQRARDGERGTVFWSPVGSGKTYTVLASLLTLAMQDLMPAYLLFTLPAGAIESISNEASMLGLPVRIINPTLAARRKTPDAHIILPYQVNLIAHDHLRHEDVVQQAHQLSQDLFLVIDEMHMFMSEGTLRTSVGLELSKTVAGFVAMTGTMIRDQHATGVREWISQIVPFEMNDQNLFVGLACAVSNRTQLDIDERRIDVDVPMTPAEQQKYGALVQPELGGFAHTTDVRAAFMHCYDVIERALVDEAIMHIQTERMVMVVARDQDMMQRLNTVLEQRGVHTFMICKGQSIDLQPHTETNIQVLLTTMRNVTGYNATRAHTMITGVYFSNQTTRTQMVGRILRTGQTNPFVTIKTLHCGLLSYTLRNYEKAKNLETAISSIASLINPQSMA